MLFLACYFTDPAVVILPVVLLHEINRLVVHILMFKCIFWRHRLGFCLFVLGVASGLLLTGRQFDFQMCYMHQDGNIIHLAISAATKQDIC